MALTAFRKSDNSVDYSALRILVVDDYPGMRSALKMTLSNFGVTKIDVAGSAFEAISRVQNNHYDVILCDFNLGDGRDGQQLLEEMRHRGLITVEAVFIMVTAESMYEKVVATAELAPDDYMIKPFSAEALRNRLENILLRKLAFMAVYHHFADNDLEAAIAGCDEILKSKPKYVVDALRFKGELLNAMGKFEEAEALYKQIIKMRVVPWARLGLAKSLHMQKKDEAAEEELRDVLDQTPEMVAAYDLLSDVCLAQKDPAAAQAVLEKGVAISGKTVRRQQKLGELAHANGDLATARNAYAAALEKGRHSVFVTPSDFGNLCRVQLEQGDLKGVSETLRNGKSTLQATPQGQLVTAINQSLVFTQSGKPDEAKKTLDEAARLCGGGARSDPQAMLDLAGACMANGRPEEADAIVIEVARNAHDSEALLGKAKRLYEEAGRREAGVAVLAGATTDVRNLNNEGVMLAQKGDFRAALEKLLWACREAPYNPRIIMNAVWVILKCLDKEGMDEALLAEARQLLEEAARQAPGHGRIAGLRMQLKEVEGRFGIRPKGNK